MMCSAVAKASSRLWSFPLLERCMRPCAVVIIPSVNKSDKRKNLGETTALVQDGIHFHHLPVVTKKTVDESIPDSPRRTKALTTTENIEHTEDPEAKEAIESLNRCHRPQEIFSLLELVPANEVTPAVALHALNKIVELENNNHFRNEQGSSQYESTMETFTRTAIVSRLIQTVCGSTNSSLLLECLKILSKDTGNSMQYQHEICNECLVRMTENRMDVNQVCDMIMFLTNVDGSLKNLRVVEKLWPGITEHEAKIDKSALMKVYTVLPHLKESQKLLYNLVERKTFDVWWQLSSEDVAEIITVLASISPTRPVLLRSLALWTSIHVHKISEEQLLKVLRGFSKLSYCDENLEKVLQRYMKVKAVKIEDPELVTEIVEYTKRFRLRLTHVLNGTCEIIMKYGKRLPSSMVHSLVTPFGTLNYYPPNGTKFYEYVENILETKFNQFRPDVMLDLVVSCVYQGHYPIKLVKRIFNPFFLDRLQSLPTIDLAGGRMLLVLFDTAMVLGCPAYEGPYLPRHFDLLSKFRDGRITRTVNLLLEPLRQLFPSTEILPEVHAEKAPLIDLYKIDVLIREKSWKASLTNRLRLEEDRKGMALIIRLSDHFCGNQKVLLGAQALRNRHLTCWGYDVYELDYNTLMKLKVFPGELQNHLKSVLSSSGSILRE